MKKQIKPIILILFLIFSLSACGKKQVENNIVGNNEPISNNESEEVNNNNDNNNQAQQEEPAEVITSDIDTSNWKTYRNEEYGFEVKYPEGWEYDLIDGLTFENKSNCTKEMLDDYWCVSRINFSKYENIGYDNVDNWRKNDLKDKTFEYVNDFNSVFKNIDYKIIKLSKVKSDNRFLLRYYFIDSYATGWEITIFYSQESELNVYDEILNSFILYK